MCPRAAQIEVPDRSVVPRPIEQWTHGEELIQSQFAVEDVSPGEAVGLFEVFRRDDLAVFDKAGQVRRVFAQGLDYGVAQSVTLALPISVLQLEGSVLHVN